MTAKSYDVAVIGAGVFGAWAARFLQKAGAKVVLVDQYGPGNSRSSSGGESRIIRMGYGADEVYTRFAMRSLPLWKELFKEAGRPHLFHKTGVLWIAPEKYQYALDSLTTLHANGVGCEQLTVRDLRRRYPQVSFEDDAWGIFEPHSGVLMARRAVRAVVDEAVGAGVEYLSLGVVRPTGKTKLEAVGSATGEKISAGSFVFACGSWLPKLFPDILTSRLFVTRQEILFFGVPPGDQHFTQPLMPTWLYLKDEFYGMPDIESRGFKVANDRHGAAADPDTQSRVASPEAVQAAKEFVARRFPALANAPVVETRVCQYENTSNGDFLIDRHPQMENVWLVGGGSGHGFKHGPAVGEYVAAQVTQTGDACAKPEPRFSLATKLSTQNRAVH
ncbi:MAG TPA: N-methyl-L-tryptophan oxidase [Candidatus Acidoferrales bacterium]